MKYITGLLIMMILITYREMLNRRDSILINGKYGISNLKAYYKFDKVLTQ